MDQPGAKWDLLAPQIDLHRPQVAHQVVPQLIKIQKKRLPIIIIIQILSQKDRSGSGAEVKVRA